MLILSGLEVMFAYLRIRLNYLLIVRKPPS